MLNKRNVYFFFFNSKPRIVLCSVPKPVHAQVHLMRWSEFTPVSLRDKLFWVFIEFQPLALRYLALLACIRCYQPWCVLYDRSSLFFEYRYNKRLRVSPQLFILTINSMFIYTPRRIKERSSRLVIFLAYLTATNLTPLVSKVSVHYLKQLYNFNIIKSQGGSYIPNTLTSVSLSGASLPSRPQTMFGAVQASDFTALPSLFTSSRYFSYLLFFSKYLHVKLGRFSISFWLQCFLTRYLLPWTGVPINWLAIHSTTTPPHHLLEFSKLMGGVAYRIMRRRIPQNTWTHIFYSIIVLKNLRPLTEKFKLLIETDETVFFSTYLRRLRTLVKLLYLCGSKRGVFVGYFCSINGRLIQGRAAKRKRFKICGGRRSFGDRSQQIMYEKFILRLRSGIVGCEIRFFYV